LQTKLLLSKKCGEEIFWRRWLNVQEYDWTGNIRELRNVVERLIILGGLKFLKTTKLFASK
jgi:transcriptional regulator with AAA-type ATPase domain